MSTQILSLLLPSDFTVPKDLKSTTPDENAFIVKAGYHAFLSYDNDKAIHNDKSFQEQLEALKAKLENERLQREEQLKKQHAAELAAAKSAQASAESAHAASEAALKKQVASAQATAESARAAQAATNASAAQAEAAARKRAQDEAAEQIRRLEQERERVATELKMERERAAAEREKLILAEREERKRAAAEIKAEQEKRIAAEREMREKLVEAERNASERIAAQAAEAKKSEADLRLQLDRAKGIKLNSSLKGAANESMMTDLLSRAFSSGEFIDKHQNSGDHIFTWEGFKILCEDKAGYEKGLPKKEIDKAHDDFIRHQDCDLMMLISTNGNIPGHTRPGDVDVGIHDSRPVIYVSNLNDNEDKELFILSLQPFIRTLIKQTKKAEQNGSDIKEELEYKIDSLTRELKDYRERVEYNRNSFNRTYRTIISSLDEYKVDLSKLGLTLRQNFKVFMIFHLLFLRQQKFQKLLNKKKRLHAVLVSSQGITSPALSVL